MITDYIGGFHNGTIRHIVKKGSRRAEKSGEEVGKHSERGQGGDAGGEGEGDGGGRLRGLG